MRSLVLVGVLLAACSGPEKLILPGQVDLKLVSGDRLRLCAEDGLEDTTPDFDCVQTEQAHPVVAYGAALRAMGWTQAEAGETRGVWTLGEGAVCRRVVIDGGRDEFARKRYALVRFEVGACGQGAKRS